MSSARVPEIRIEAWDRSPVDPHGDFVLYWMVACRRVRWNFGLQRAVDWARELDKPLVVVEVLDCGEDCASDRHHRFVLQGMADNARELSRHPVRYYPYVHRKADRLTDLLGALCARCCVAITDDFPVGTAAAPMAQPPVRLEKVDSNGLLPMRAADRVFPTAYAFRRFLQRVLPDHLLEMPKANPLSRVKLPRLKALAEHIPRRWPAASPALLAARPEALVKLPIDHGVRPAALAGGPNAARAVLRRFLKHRLARYDQDRNQPEEEVTSGLSPYLHYGHISAHEIFHALARQQRWSPDRLSEKVTGRREGWWGMSQPAEAFLDELVTWREIGFNMCSKRPDYDQYESLPDWAKVTLRKHSRDRREHVYTLEEFETARTHDPLWNAAQTQLVREGRIHNYLRMLWGKKILAWTASPQEALQVMIRLNNKYALDGRDPNSYSGILWVLGRYDRPWAPERPVFGRVRYMSSKNTARKVRVKSYIEEYARVDAI